MSLRVSLDAVTRVPTRITRGVTTRGSTSHTLGRPSQHCAARGCTHWPWGPRRHTALCALREGLPQTGDDLLVPAR
ncbi:hypothetical protein E2C01_059670 [Portunus trituberculatus]|uniref:Uncharacterized protein n=1 Tax=Portunus trituberculatus TaxID=210409 RepID=A0A5B7H601_PORTR|nr:hypothetical protein [Portunus trituberculatus]